MNIFAVGYSFPDMTFVTSSKTNKKFHTCFVLSQSSLLGSQLYPTSLSLYLGNTSLNSKAATNIAYIAFQLVGQSKINFLDSNYNCLAISPNFVRQASYAIRYFTLSRTFSIAVSFSLNTSCTNKLMICAQQCT